GTIYAAIDSRSGCPVALKRLHPLVADDPIIAARFEREMVILEKLSHPNIVRYHGGGSEDGRMFFAMELVSGGTLKQLLATYQTLTWQEAIACATQICSALQHAHNHGIIHRDLKPANLYVGQAGELKIGDFGIARDLGEADITSSGLTVGSHSYMSPEQIRGDTTVSEKTDLYALGCVLFEMLIGHAPFLGDNFAQLFEQHLHTPPPRVRDFVADCPAELDALITKLLAKSPDARPFNARTVQATLLKIAEQHLPTAENSQDPAIMDQARQFGRRELSNRVLGLTPEPAADVSWVKLAAVFLLAAGLVALAAFCQAN
ncbi:MAG: serine/threonine protein kinase, partial [Planctomycetales bacterium]|nr:serine/threonine protein kinase [Planctomycetales bacterium]